MIDDDIIEVIDDNNNHVRLHILFTFNDDNTNTDYLFLYEEGKEDDVFVKKLSKDDVLLDLNDEEFEMASEVFNAFNNEEDN